MRLLVSFWLLVALAACPRTRRPLLPAAPTTGDVTARARFTEVSTRYESGSERAEAFAEIASDFPDDPIAPWATLYAGMEHTLAGEYQVAADELAALHDTREPALQRKARLYRGVALVYLQRFAEAGPLLEEAEPAIESSWEQSAWLASSAVAQSEGVTPLRALPLLERWWERATEPEKGYVMARTQELVDRADVEAWTTLQTTTAHGPIVRYAIARRMAREGHQNDLADAAAAVGFSVAAQTPVSSHIGVLAAQKGKHAKVGEVVVAALAVAAGATDPTQSASVLIRDADTPDVAAQSADVLASEGVSVLIGPTDGAAADAVAARCERNGTLLISLATRPDERLPRATTFHVVHSAEARAAALADQATQAGATRIVTVGPDNGYGRAVVAAFRQRAGALGAAVNLYPPDTKSFAMFVAALGDNWDAIFVADTAERLSLLAPALAAAGHVSQQTLAKKPKGARAILLFATADGLTDEFFRTTGRHTLGAHFAPGFFANGSDALSGRLRTMLGRSPTALDAYALDAVTAAEAWQTSGQPARAFRDVQIDGLTGRMVFDENGRRTDRPLMYVGVGTTADPIP